MRRSLESARPILNATDHNNHASNRFSTYSMATPSENSYSSQSTHTDIKNYNNTYDRLTSKKLQEQRFVVSPDKEDTLDKLALAGKLQKALDRRYTGQDATMRPKPSKQDAKPLSEKTAAR